MAPEEPGGARVVVHDRLKVGPYQATVLSATGPGVLTNWLRNHHYRFPEEGQEVVDGYVERRWFFVALRISPQERRQADLMSDLPPSTPSGDLRGRGSASLSPRDKLGQRATAERDRPGRAGRGPAQAGGGALGQLAAKAAQA